MLSANAIRDETVDTTAAAL